MLFKSLVGVDWLACCERVNERGVQKVQKWRSIYVGVLVSVG
jgi:hypothetical protein